MERAQADLAKHLSQYIDSIFSSFVDELQSQRNTIEELTDRLNQISIKLKKSSTKTLSIEIEDSSHSIPQAPQSARVGKVNFTPSRPQTGEPVRKKLEEEAKKKKEEAKKKKDEDDKRRKEIARENMKKKQEENKKKQEENIKKAEDGKKKREETKKKSEEIQQKSSEEIKQKSSEEVESEDKIDEVKEAETDISAPPVSESPKKEIKRGPRRFSLEEIEAELKKMRDIYPESELNENKPLELSVAAKSALNLLSSISDQKLYINSLPDDNVMWAFRLYFQLMGRELPDDKEQAWPACREFLMQCKQGNRTLGKINLDKYLIESVSTFDFREANVDKIEELLAGRESFLNPTVYDDFCKLTAFLMFSLKEAVIHSGALKELAKPWRWYKRLLHKKKQLEES